MPVTIVLGGQWGDEGKGQITDTLAKDAQIVARATGGSNAGHTVVNERGRFAVHLIPSGIFTPGVTCVLGNGMVIGPQTLLSEMDALAAHGIDLSNLHISDKAHLVMPYHPMLDTLEEERRGEAAIGTTRRGIGPAYMDKMARSGIRVADLLDEESLRSRLDFLLPYRNDQFVKIFGAAPLELEPLVEELLGYGERLRPYVTQTEVLLNDALDAGKHVLVEGAQAALLDPDFGTYPFVTSSSPTAAGACLGTGIAPARVTTVLGVFKAYCSRVGSGPMPTELTNAVGDTIRERGREYGTTTGRPRRTGWFDAVAARYVVRLNGITQVALTGIGVLGAFETIKVCTGYRVGGERVQTIPTLAEAYARAEPIYEEWPGWQTDTSDARTAEDLPPNALAYIARLEELLGAEIVLVGVAVTTCRPAVGATCPHVRAGVGAISTQAMSNPYWGIVGLDLMERGDDTETVLAKLRAADDGAAHRQWIGIGRQGPGVAWTGEETIVWSGHRVGADYATAGNMLVSEPTIAETERAYLASAGEPLMERLMRALEAGQAAGGDQRGRQSAAMRVVATEPHPILDLRVDDHPDPVAELRRLLDIWFADMQPRLAQRPRRADLRL